MCCRAIGTVVIVVIVVMVVMQKLHKVTRLRLRLVPPRAEATHAETGFAAEWPGRQAARQIAERLFIASSVWGAPQVNNVELDKT